jgi:Ca-activated chloride channel family protein
MFTLGIDQAVNAAFLRRLAAAGGGLCELVESEDRLDAVMAKVHRRIGTPIATELALRATGLELDRGALAPAKLPDVYAGAPVVILGRYRGTAPAGASIQIEGTSLGDPLRMTVASSSAAHGSTWLAASWARAHLRDLEDQYAATARGELAQQIVRVSKQFSVLSRFTAFVAIDRSQVVNQGGVLHQVVQPVEEPAGWGGAAPDYSETCVLLADSAPSDSYSQKTAMKIATTGIAKSSPPSGRLYGGPPAAPSLAGSPILGGGAAPPPPGGSAPLSKGIGQSPPARNAPRPGPQYAASVATPSSSESSSIASTAYLVQLATLARELEARATGRGDPAAIRLLRERLTEWVEDVRSVGGNHELAGAVEALVKRLSAALAAPASLLAEATAIAGELAVLAAGAPPPAKKQSRLAFWK